MSYERPLPDMHPLKERLRSDDPLLLPYQQHLLKTTEQNQVVICEKSRRIGFTWGIAADAVLTAASEKSDGGMDVFYLAYEREMTREFIDTCAAWARLFDKACGDVEEVIFKDKDANGEPRDILAFRIRFASGYEVFALSSSPRGLRGRQGYVIIDEAAFHDDLDQVIKSAMALLMWGGKVLVISTHIGVDNPFNQLVEDAKTQRKPYAYVRVTFDDALADGLFRRICLVAGEPWSPEAEAAWRQRFIDFYGEHADEELFCIPTEGGSAWIAYDLIKAAQHADAGKPELFEGRPAYLGNDIARRRDRWVTYALERVGDVLWVREGSVLHNAPFRHHDEEMDRLEAHYRPIRIAMDQTGMGEKPVEDAKYRYGDLRVEGVIMSGDRRLNVATAARKAFEDGKIRIPDDPDLRNDLKKIKRVSGPTGASRLIAGRDASGHADRAWALFLAIACADIAETPIEFEAVRQRTDWGDTGGGRSFGEYSL